ncbi:MAG: DUF3795 domain-containing protein [Chloroflexota bacterium]
MGARTTKINHIEIGICGLSCRLCPAYYRETRSKCGGCKSQYRMGAPCPFHNCALKKKNVEFCGFCSENISCNRWRKHREMGKQHDSIVSYQKLETNIDFIRKRGLEEFEKQQKAREKIVQSMLSEFNEGRSKTFYCIAATMLEIDELEKALDEAREKSINLNLKTKAKIMHSILNTIAEDKNYVLRLRK